MSDPKSRSSTILVAGLSLYAALSLISMATMSIGAAVLVACLLYYHGGALRFVCAVFGRASSLRTERNTRIFAWISVAFALACLLSLIVARLWPLSYGGHFSLAHPLKDSAKLWYFVWPFVLWHSLELCAPQGRRTVLKTWLGVFLALSVIGIFQHFTGWPRPQRIPSDVAHFHVTLFLGHHLSVASILIFPFFAWLDLPGIPRGWRATGAILGFIALMGTYSRMLWIALPVGLVFWALLKLKRRERWAVVVGLVAVIGVASLVPSVRARVRYSDGVQERRDLWEANWNFFENRPLTGVGLKHNEELSGYYLMQKYKKTDVFQGHAHDNLLDLLGSTGALGALAFLAWWAFLVWLLAREIRADGSSVNSAGGRLGQDFFGRGLLAAFLVYQLNGLTQVNFWEAKVQHQLMWMVAWVLLWQRSAACKES